MNPLEAMEALLDLVRRAVREDFRQVVREELAARAASPATGLVSVATFADEHALCDATVRAMIRDGRLQATRIGKRAVRIRRDATIGQPAGRPSSSSETPAERARRILGDKR